MAVAGIGSLSGDLLALAYVAELDRRHPALVLCLVLVSQGCCALVALMDRSAVATASSLILDLVATADKEGFDRLSGLACASTSKTKWTDTQ